jgi:hypothetical protein
MVLCRKCAHATHISALSCSRCGYALPYWRSRRWRVEVGLPRLTVGKRCPLCKTTTHRQRTPLWARPLRTLTLHHCSQRSCPRCGWRGFAFHRRSQRQKQRVTQ